MLTVPRLARAAPPAPALQAAYSSLLGTLTEALSPAPALAWVEVGICRFGVVNVFRGPAHEIPVRGDTHLAPQHFPHVV